MRSKLWLSGWRDLGAALVLTLVVSIHPGLPAFAQGKKPAKEGAQSSWVPFTSTAFPEDAVVADMEVRRASETPVDVMTYTIGKFQLPLLPARLLAGRERDSGDTGSGFLELANNPSLMEETA